MTVRKSGWFYRVIRSSDYPYSHVHVNLFYGTVGSPYNRKDNDTLYLEEQMSLSWQNDERNLHWYGFRIELHGIRDLEGMERCTKFVRRLTSKAGRLGFEVAPSRIREALAAMGVEQIEHDQRSDRWELVKNLHPDGDYCWFMPYDYHVAQCRYLVWAATEKEAKAKIVAKWTSEMAKCVAEGSACRSCADQLAQYIRDDCPVERVGWTAPLVYDIPDNPPEKEEEDPIDAFLRKAREQAPGSMDALNSENFDTVVQEVNDLLAETIDGNN